MLLLNRVVCREVRDELETGRYKLLERDIRRAFVIQT
jgi:hypothetical protein